MSYTQHMSDHGNEASQPEVPFARRNIEIKARIDDLDAARTTAEQLATDRVGILQQVDTYFRCQAGRLKLREITGQPSELIWYERPDLAGPRESRYGRVLVENAPQVKEDLQRLLGISKVVEKRREVYLYHNVRIHLDDVRGVGRFLEFEAVIDGQNDERTGRARVEVLCERFTLSPSDFIARSYADMQ